jgi:diguanylate cyclase (GGDEF)-like protein/PAS domain S-box-containing protein
LRYVNDEVCRRLGQSRQALLRLRVTDVAGLWSTPQQWAVLWDQLALQTSMSLECLHRRQDGTEFPVEVQACRFVFLGRTYVLCLVRDITQRKQADEHIRQLAFYDHLTGLANRRLLRDRLQHSLNSRRRQARPGALMMLDLDHFKQLNDTLGHDVGDQFLIEVARRLQACVRDADTVARLGGDEFVVMLENLNEDGDAATQAQGVARKILHTLAQVHELNLSPPGEAPRTHRYLGTASLGIALFHDSTLSVDELLKRADVAMYHAKSAGRNTFCFFEGEARVQPPTAGA